MFIPFIFISSFEIHVVFIFLLNTTLALFHKFWHLIFFNVAIFTLKNYILGCFKRHHVFVGNFQNCKMTKRRKQKLLVCACIIVKILHILNNCSFYFFFDKIISYLKNFHLKTCFFYLLLALLHWHQIM